MVRRMAAKSFARIIWLEKSLRKCCGDRRVDGPLYRSYHTFILASMTATTQRWLCYMVGRVANGWSMRRWEIGFRRGQQGYGGDIERRAAAGNTIAFFWNDVERGARASTDIGHRVCRYAMNMLAHRVFDSVGELANVIGTKYLAVDQM